MEPPVTRPDPHTADVSAMGRALADALPDPTAAALARQRARFVMASTADRRPSRLAVAALALVGVGAAVMVARGARTPASPPSITARVGSHALRPGEWVAATSTPLELRFSDGSVVTLAPGASARVESFDLRGARVLLERGRAEARVHHTAQSAWRFAAGPYSVDVTGTAFALAWSPDDTRFDLAMREGRVVLRGPRCAEGIAVRDRDEVHADVRAATLTVGPMNAAVAALPTPQIPIPVAEDAGAVAMRTRPSRGVSVASRGAHAAPSREVDAQVVEAPAVVEGEAAVMLREADGARLAGQGMRAREVLLDLRARFGGSPEAVRAAFVLGVLSLETFRAPAEAARWFELCLRESPDGPLAREARGRRVQSLHAAGDTAGARAAARVCLDRDPEGPFAPFARGILAE